MNKIKGLTAIVSMMVHQLLYDLQINFQIAFYKVSKRFNQFFKINIFIVKVDFYFIHLKR